MKMMLLAGCAMMASVGAAWADPAPGPAANRAAIDAQIEKSYPALDALYHDIH